jgi:hypothetical protein
VRGLGPEQVEYAGSAARLRDVWIAVRANLRAVWSTYTIADVARGELPASVEELAANPDAWQPHEEGLQSLYDDQWDEPRDREGWASREARSSGHPTSSAT